jgi:hypothetical protein
VAKLVLTDVNVSVNGTALTSSIGNAELSIESDDVETTSFGSAGGWRTRIGGLKAANVSLTFMQDYAAGSVDATLFPLLNTIGTIVLTPAGTAVSATNPSFTFNCLINALTEGGQVGDLATFDVTWPVTGPVTRATA